MADINIRTKFIGGMVGSALGDAIGELAFRYRDKETLCRQLEQQQKYLYTDDTAMAIGIAESLIEKGNLDPRHLGKRFTANFHKEPWRGYGPGPPTIFSMVEERGISCTEAAKALFRGRGSFGNGAAMRAAPVGLFFHDSQDLYDKASLSASITHAHPVGKDGAAVQAKAASLVLSLDPREEFPGDEFMNSLVKFARTPEMKEKMTSVRQLIGENVPPSQAAQVLGRSVVVHESQPFALYAFLRYPHSFQDCLFCAVLHGGDRDTMGAMACAISGSYVGVNAIPHLWREKLENDSYITNLALKLFMTKTNKGR
jgi:poly(ADP-ribose) glycohydrolase ARH3